MTSKERANTVSEVILSLRYLSEFSDCDQGDFRLGQILLLALSEVLPLPTVGDLFSISDQELARGLRILEDRMIREQRERGKRGGVLNALLGGGL